MQDALHEADELVLEYILFRGFTETYRTFGTEQKQDKTRCFNVDRLLEQLQTCCATHDAAGLLDLWGFLKTTFFSHLDEIEAATVSQTENDLKRNFIVAAIMDGQSEKAVSFLQMQADSLARDPRWREWFSLPFLSNPSADPHFSVYFQREWRDLFNASLRNFLASTLRKTPMPKLLAFELSRMRQSADRCALASKTAEALQLNERVSELELAVEHQRRQNCELLAHLRSHLVGLTSADAIAALAAATADAALPGGTASTLEPRFRAALRGEAAVAAASNACWLCCMLTGFFGPVFKPSKRVRTVPSGLLKDRARRSAVYHEMLTLMLSADELGAVLTPVSEPPGMAAREAEVSKTWPTCQPPTTYSPNSLQSLSPMRDMPSRRGRL